MEIPTTGKGALEALCQKFGTSEIVRLSEATGIRPQVLSAWRDKPDIELRLGGREHLRRVLLGETVQPRAQRPSSPVAPPATIAQLADEHAALRAEVAELRADSCRPRPGACDGAPGGVARASRGADNLR